MSTAFGPCGTIFMHLFIVSCLLSICVAQTSKNDSKPYVISQLELQSYKLNRFLKIVNNYFKIVNKSVLSTIYRMCRLYSFVPPFKLTRVLLSMLNVQFLRWNSITELISCHLWGQYKADSELLCTPFLTYSSLLLDMQFTTKPSSWQLK